MDWPAPANAPGGVALQSATSRKSTRSEGEPDSLSVAAANLRGMCRAALAGTGDSAFACAPGQTSGSAGADRVLQLKSRMRAFRSDRLSTAAEPSLDVRHSLAPSAQRSRPLSPSQSPSRPVTPRNDHRDPQERLSSILSFLDEAEASSRDEVRSGRGDSVGQPATHAQSNGQSNDETFSRSALEVEVQDKRKIISILKQALTEAKERERRIGHDVAQEWEAKMEKQRLHYEAGMERQLQLVDKLLSDKADLTKRCEVFSEELKAVERKFQLKIEELQEHSAKELTRQKQNWTAAEKLRREAWEKEKVREIKEMTIKGLQPEVERILAERKQEKQKLDVQHKEALETQRKELLDLAQRQARDLREQLLREQTESLENERDVHRRKLREEFERGNVQLQEERAKLAADLLTECRKHEQLLHGEAERAETRLREAVATERKRGEAALQEITLKFKTSHRRSSAQKREVEEQHSSQISALQEAFEKDKQSLQETISAKVQAEFAQREVVFREELTRERDQKLNAMMDRLSREHVEQRTALKQESATQIEQVRCQAETESASVVAELTEAQTRALKLKSTCAELEERVCRVERESRHEVDRNRELQARNDVLEDRWRDVDDNTRKAQERHVADENKLNGMSEQIEAIREQFVAVKATLEEERSRSRTMHDEMSQRDGLISGIEARVKRTVQAKEDQIADLRNRCTAAENKARELEYLLARQRDELLGVKVP